MRWSLLVMAILIVALLQTTDAAKKKYRKKVRGSQVKKHQAALRAKEEELLKAEAEFEAEVEEYEDAITDDLEEEFDQWLQDEEDEEDEEIEDEPEEEEESGPVDPCFTMYCGAGRECFLDDDDEPHCRCAISCDPETDDRRRVCSNHNETWDSDCELYRQRCICTEGHDGCLDEKLGHVHIEYYGNCKEVEECQEHELADFPRRMREWLFSIMRDLAERHQLSSHYMEMEKQAEDDEQMRWTNAVVWKWCDLDGQPKDNGVSRHELFPIKAPLFALEHCIGPFLDSCDPDDDHIITLDEWTSCLKLSPDDVAKIEKKCDDVRDIE